MSRTGKIARLPHHIREHLNLRILNGESGVRLVAWLNALPEVQATLIADFAGRPINDQNLSAWRLGGYETWLRQSLEQFKAIQTSQP